MSLRLYFDVNTPGPLFDGVTRLGLDAIRAQDVGHDETDDHDILDYAAEVGRIVVTMDSDFLRIATARQSGGIPFAGVVFARQSGIDYGRVLEDLQLACDVYEPTDMLGRVEYLPFSR